MILETASAQVSVQSLNRYTLQMFIACKCIQNKLILAHMTLDQRSPVCLVSVIDLVGGTTL